jgi:hypothetical protein
MADTIDAMDISLQLVAAFGQGAGIMMIDTNALRPAYDAYVADITRVVPEWDTHAHGSIAAVRAMGAYAAHRALSERRLTISREDVEAALGVVRHVNARSLARCRITRLDD